MNLGQWPLLESDSKEKPAIFQWNGSLPRTEVEAWAHSSKHKIPAFLIDLWVETGGGDLFESESILTPIKIHSFSDGVDEINDWHWSQGLPSDYLIFQKGLFLSAVNEGGRILTLNQSYAPESVFSDFSVWYLQTIRKEFGARYGLPRV